jgi:predicted metal-dependent enzyme (double-stranded beta helix superfamily)
VVGFDIDTFVEDCRTANADPDPRSAIRELLLDRLRTSRGDIAAALGKDESGLNVIYSGDDLTILNVIWAPKMTIFPHDHRMWATIGIYAGAEDNRLYKRGTERLQHAGERQLDTGDVIGLGAEAIHAVHNPRSHHTGAIHIYGGDFVHQPRSQWDPDTLLEEPYDIEQVQRAFAKANEDWKAQLGSDVDESVV